MDPYSLNVADTASRHSPKPPSVEFPESLWPTRSAFGPSTPVRMTISLRFQQELAIPHNLFVIHPNIELPPHHVDMSRRIPLGPSMRAVRIAEGNVYPGIFLVLQNLPNHIL